MVSSDFKFFTTFHHDQKMLNSSYFHFLFVLQKYQEHLKEIGSDGDYLNAVIEFLQHTSEIVSLFNDRSSDELM